jgi:hypothetical protein
MFPTYSQCIEGVAEYTTDDATAIGLELNGFLDVSVAGAAI